jgi:hypothetical protein
VTRAIIGSTCLLALMACGRRPLDVGRGSSSGGGGAAGTVDGSASGGGPGTAGALDAGGGAVLKQIGEACAEGIDCESSFCANGVCCRMFCGGDCWSCAVAGSVGNCEPVPAESPCAPARCDGNTLTLASTCDGRGTCRESPLLACAPFACDAQAAACRATCASDADCADATCVNGSCARTPFGGVSCMSDDECASGFCADGVCCNVACRGGCVSCALPGRTGTCWPVEAGIPDPRGVCRDQGASSCGTTGACDGFGACARYEAATLCAVATCVGATLTPPKLCDGLGACLPSSPSTSCAPHLCRSDAAQCAVDNCPGGDSICVAGAYCSGNEQCAPRKAGGSPCASDHECTSFKCLSGSDGGPSVCASLI